MHPRLITTPYFVLYTFGLFLAAAYGAALWLLLRGARREKLNPERAAGLGVWVVIGAIVGAKLLVVVRSLPDYLHNPADLLSSSLIRSAGDFYGGFLGALAAALLFFYRYPEIPRWRMADLCAPSIALGQAIGRIGCFMAGDDYGRPAHLPWAVTFRDPDAAEVGGAPLGLALHPVQIYESLICWGLFLFLLWLSRRRRFNGEVILAYSILYAIARFFLEYFRGDADRGFVFGGLLSTSQFIAILIAIVCIPLFFIQLKKSRTCA
jgi:phosphatidylglycerol---prolipoprotein diacylglyceryl transferase